MPMREAEPVLELALHVHERRHPARRADTASAVSTPKQR